MSGHVNIMPFNGIGYKISSDLNKNPLQFPILTLTRDKNFGVAYIILALNGWYSILKQLIYFSLAQNVILKSPPLYSYVAISICFNYRKVNFKL